MAVSWHVLPGQQELVALAPGAVSPFPSAEGNCTSKSHNAAMGFCGRKGVMVDKASERAVSSLVRDTAAATEMSRYRHLKTSEQRIEAGAGWGCGSVGQQQHLVWQKLIKGLWTDTEPRSWGGCGPSGKGSCWHVSLPEALELLPQLGTANASTRTPSPGWKWLIPGVWLHCLFLAVPGHGGVAPSLLLQLSYGLPSTGCG